MLRRTAALLDTVAGHWATAAGMILAAIVAVTTVNAALFLADRVADAWGGDVAGLPGYEDAVRLLLSAAAPMFLPWCQARRGHVVAEILGRGQGVPARRLDRFWAGATAFLCVFLGWFMAQGLAEARDDGVLSPVLGWPEWPFYLPGLVSLALWGAIAALQAAGSEGR
jgi:hypothetical protein